MAISRCILIESGLPYLYWPFAVHNAVYTTNRLSTKRIGWHSVLTLHDNSAKCQTHANIRMRGLCSHSYVFTFIFGTNCDTWMLVEAPKGTKHIASGWVFTKKRAPNGQETYKARLVANGYSKDFGFDYDETYASVLAQTSLRILISLSVNNYWKVYQKDFTTAYLNASLLTPMYILSARRICLAKGR